jgi:DNA-binding NarL/FixJ family response regulator
MPSFRLEDDPARLPPIIDELRGAGRIVVGEVADAICGTVYVAQVADSRGAESAVLAALGGADLVLACTARDEVVDSLFDDLRRLGTVQDVLEPDVTLTADQVALLSRLHRGQSLGAAAASEHLSRRTADRRLAAARAALGVRTTAQALVAAARQGLLD